MPKFNFKCFFFWLFDVIAASYVISCDIAQSTNNTIITNGSFHEYIAKQSKSVSSLAIDLFVPTVQYTHTNMMYKMVYLFIFFSLFLYFPNCIIRPPFSHRDYRNFIQWILEFQHWSISLSRSIYIFFCITDAILWKPIMGRVNIIILWFDLS